MDDVQVVLFNEQLDILCYVTRGHASPNKDITKILQNAIHKILSTVDILTMHNAGPQLFRLWCHVWDKDPVFQKLHIW